MRLWFRVPQVLSSLGVTRAGQGIRKRLSRLGRWDLGSVMTVNLTAAIRSQMLLVNILSAHYPSAYIPLGCISCVNANQPFEREEPSALKQ